MRPRLDLQKCSKRQRLELAETYKHMSTDKREREREKDKQRERETEKEREKSRGSERREGLANHPRSS